MTAGHCVKTAADCANTKIIFDYAVKEDGEMPARAGGNNIYSCSSVIVTTATKGADYALLRLDRPVSGRTPLKINGANDIASGTPLTVIGYPMGIPMKIDSGPQKVARDVSNPEVFMAALDTFGGNSGSAVFNAKTGLIEGILVRGDKDFIKTDNCMTVQVNPADGGIGESVTKAFQVLPFLRADFRNGTAMDGGVPSEPAKDYSAVLNNLRKPFGDDRLP